MANAASKSTVKILTIAIGIPVGMTSRRLVARIWATARPAAKVRRETQSGPSWGDTLGWALLSTTGIVVTELVSRTAAETAYRAVLGIEPPITVSWQRSWAERRAAKAEKKAGKKTAITAG